MNSVKLLAFDHRSLQADLERLKDRVGSSPRALDDARDKYEGWTGLGLINAGGDPTSARADRPTLKRHVPSPLLGEVPAIRAVLESIPAPIRCARLMKLGPRAKITPHEDPWHSFASGLLRLHVPIVAPEGATCIIGGEAAMWKEGELWFGDFRRTHAVVNESDVTRVNLIVDVDLTPELLRLFPPEFAAQKMKQGVAFAQTPLSLGSEELAALCCSFEVPKEFTNGTGMGRGALRGSIERDDEGLVLSFDGSPTARLDCLGPGRLHILGTPPGWALQISAVAGRASLAFLEAPDFDYAMGRRIVREVMLPIVA